MKTIKVTPKFLSERMKRKFKDHDRKQNNKDGSTLRTPTKIMVEVMECTMSGPSAN